MYTLKKHFFGDRASDQKYSKYFILVVIISFAIILNSKSTKSKSKQIITLLHLSNKHLCKRWVSNCRLFLLHERFHNCKVHTDSLHPPFHTNTLINQGNNYNNLLLFHINKFTIQPPPSLFNHPFLRPQCKTWRKWDYFINLWQELLMIKCIKVYWYLVKHSHFLTIISMVF